MPIKFGTTSIPSIYKGNTKIDKIYKGLNLVYQSSLLPSGYTLCEYLESTGTEYIDTGYYATNTSGINIDYAYAQSGNAGLCGIFQGQEPRTDTLFVTTNSGQTSSAIYLLSQGAQLTNNVVPQIGTKCNAKINYLNNGKLIIDNTTTGNNGSNGVVSSRTIKLFCRDYNGGLSYTNARIYICQISEDENVVRDLIPCLDNNGVPCMYDTVSKQTFYNQGEGEFSYKVDESVLPAGYTLCDYLESTGTQYIDTNYYAVNTSGINIDYAYAASGNAGLCGIFQNQVPRTDTLFITTNSGQTSSEIYLISQGAQLAGNTPQLGTKYNAKINYLNNGKLILDNTKTGNNGSNGVVSSRTIKLFCRDYNGNLAYTNARIYGCALTTGNTVSKYLVPCLDRNGTPCMYDVIGKQTYYNAGSGTFNYG